MNGTRPLTSRLVACSAALVAAAGLGLGAEAARGHGGESHGAGWPGRAATAGEQRLREGERAALGADHAVEHARLRAYQADPAWRRAQRSARATARRARARMAQNGALDRNGRWPASGQFDLEASDGTEVFAINAVMLPTGKVLWYSYPNGPDAPQGPQRVAHALLWDPERGTGPRSLKRIDPPVDPATGQPANIWCGGSSFLANGVVLAAGGTLRYPAETPAAKYAGLNHLYTFDPFSERWTRQPDMAHGRWYPTQLLMPDGRTLLINGLDEGGEGAKNEDLELFTPARSRTGVGRLGLLGPAGVLGDTGQPPVGDYYPHLFWMPSGRGLVAGPWTTDTWWFQPVGNPPRLRWEEIGNNMRSRVWGTAVPMPAGPDGSHEVRQFGGSDKPAADGQTPPGDALATKSVERFNERRARQGWQETDDVRFGALNRPRSHANTVLLPDASMVTIGGGWGDKKGGGENGAPGQWAAADFHLRTELWDPRRERWRLGPPQREYRTYHSTAVLLPDGRVVSGGDEYSGRFAGAQAPRNYTEDSAEIYEPPYLFDGNRRARRPSLVRAPERMRHNARATLRVKRGKQGRAVTKAVLIAPSATTHAVDMNQRYVPLRVTRRSRRSLTVKAPANRDIALPGYYMLFVLDRTGTPSVADWVRLA